MKKYQHITIAGTFDRLHAGHEAFIDYAFKISEKVSVAITAADFPYQKKLQNYIEPFEIRKKGLQLYLEDKNYLKQAAIIPIHDFYGFALEDTTLDGILVTKDTYKNAVKINKKRESMGMKRLSIISIPFVKGKDKRIIKSSRIRSGEINRAGYVYASRFINKKTLTLPSDMRHIMRKPLGDVFENEVKIIQHIERSKPSMVISVGDVVTESLQKRGFTPDITIIDFKTRRKRIHHERNQKNRAYRNKAGTIQQKAVRIFKKDIQEFINKNKKNSLYIKGEEDLLALPAILLAPLNSIVLYGQFDLGIVATEVTEEKKRDVEKLLEQFT